MKFSPSERSEKLFCFTQTSIPLTNRITSVIFGSCDSLGQIHLTKAFLLFESGTADHSNTTSITEQWCLSIWTYLFSFPPLLFFQVLFLNRNSNSVPCLADHMSQKIISFVYSLILFKKTFLFCITSIEYLWFKSLLCFCWLLWVVVDIDTSENFSTA